MWCYGEDGLTLWALITMREQLFARFALTFPKDSFDVDTRLFYRISFGRRGGMGSKQFGEFDFIIKTKKTIYLGESKWCNSSEFSRNRRDPNRENLQLSDVQFRRHRVMRWYINNWSGNWEDLIETYQNAPNDIPNLFSLPENNDNLKSILGFFLELVDAQNIETVKDVLLLFDTDDGNITINQQDNIEFIPVIMQVEENHINSLFEL